MVLKFARFLPHSDSLQDILVTGDQLMHSATLNETADHSGFEYSWKFLEWCLVMNWTLYKTKV